MSNPFFKNRGPFKISEIINLYSKLKSKYNDKFYLEIQRHND